MKKFFFIIIFTITFMTMSQLFSQSVGDTIPKHYGVCNGNSGIEHFWFLGMPGDSLVSYKMTTFIAWCDNNEYPYSVRIFEPFGVKGFHSFGNVLPFDSCSYTLIHSNYCYGDTNTHLYLQEVYGQSSNYIGLIYGSCDWSHTSTADTADYKIFTSYLIDLSISDPFAGGYTAPEISYVREFTAGDGSYLDQIFDNDRSLLVGIRYYSATNSTTTTRYFKPNN